MNDVMQAVGVFFSYAVLAALAVGKVLGLPDAAIHDGLGKCVVKGRVELVPISKKFTILLDYAHNEVSTESLLTTLRAYKPHRLVVVFGCGGNRYAVDHAQEGDLIAVIGKGHETYRDREGVKTPFLERELLEEYAQQIGLE